MTGKLNHRDVQAVHCLEKHGELILAFSGAFFVNSTSYGSVDRKRIESLARRGYCRIDRVGESTFAVFVKA